MQLKNISLIIVILIFVFGILFANAQTLKGEYVLLTFSYNNSSFVLLNKSLEKGNYPDIFVEKNYQLSLVSYQDSILYSISFDPSLLYTDEGNETLKGGVIFLNESVFYVLTPNFEELNLVRIAKDNQTIFEEDIHDVGATSCRV